MCALLDRSFAVIFDATTPEQDLTFVIGGLQFQPDIVSINRSAGKKVTNLAGANHRVHQHIVAVPDHRLNAVKRRSNRSHGARLTFRWLGLRLFTNGKSGRQLGLRSHARFGFRARG